MRGSPPIQALFLILTLLILGFLGSRYINMKDLSGALPPASETATTPQDHTEAEIELIFSSSPISYTLKIPSNQGGEPIVVVQSNTEIENKIENPAYHDITIPSHHLTTYWLDIIWKDDPTSTTKHFVQINISPSHGEGKNISFWSDSKELTETFDYSTEGEPTP